MGKQSRIRKYKAEYKRAELQAAREMYEVKRTSRLYDRLHSNEQIPKAAEAVFVIDNILEAANFGYSEDTAIFRTDVSLRLPFKTIFVEASGQSITDMSGAGFGNIGIWFSQDFDNNLDFFLYMQFGDDINSETYDVGFGYVYTDDEMRLQDYLLNTANGTSFHMWEFSSPAYWEKETLDSTRAQEILRAGLFAVAFLNCRNVEYQDHVPTSEASMRHNKMFGVPLTKFKTLKIKPLKKHKNDSEQMPYQGLMPLHIRRGSFATYTDESPLFGKYTGTFWRPATVVGEKENGVVLKDYEVQSPEDKSA